MAWSAPKTWTTAELATASHLNINMRDNPNFLHDPPTARVFIGGTFTFPSNTWTAPPYTSEDWDTDNQHSNTTNTGRLTAVTAGKYLYFAHQVYPGQTTGYTGLRFLRNSVTILALQSVPGMSTQSHVSVATLAPVNVGDFVEAQAFQNSGIAFLIGRAHPAEGDFGNIWMSG